MAQPKQKPGLSKQDYATPPAFIEAVKRLLTIKRFAFDFAADETNAKALRWWGEDLDSLSMSPHEWASQLDSDWGWLNPPFAKIAPWARHCASVARTTDGKIAFLVPAAVGSNWFRDYVWNQHAHTIFVNGRIPFMPDKPTWLYPKDCILVLYAFGYQGSRIWTWRDAVPAPDGEEPRTSDAVDPIGSTERQSGSTRESV